MLPGDLVEVSEIPCPVCETKMMVSKHPNAHIAAIKDLNVCTQCGYKNDLHASKSSNQKTGMGVLIIFVLLIFAIVSLLCFLGYKFIMA